MGTVLFTLLAFLFPTVAVFYLCILMIYLGGLSMTLSFEVLLQFIFDFPLYHLLLRWISPPFTLSSSFILSSTFYRLNDRGPSDGNETPREISSNDSAMKLYLYLKPSPLSFHKLFLPLSQKLGHLFYYYFCLDALKAILFGNVLLPFTKRPNQGT